MGLLVVAAILAGTFAYPLYRQTPADLSWRLLLTGGGLVLAAFQMPNVWMQLGFAWCGLLVAWVHLGQRRKILPVATHPMLHVERQENILWAAVAFLLLHRLWTPEAWTPFAIGWVSVCCLSVALTEYIRYGGRLPEGYFPTPGVPPAGLFAHSPMSCWAYMIGGGCIAYLMVVQSPLWALVTPVLAFGVQRAKNAAAPLAALPVVALLLAIRAPLVALPMAGLACVGTGSWFWSHVRSTSSTAVRKGISRYAWSKVVESKGWGLGFGAWASMNVVVTDTNPKIDPCPWTTIHNDWLQGALEGGAPLILCALGAIASAVAQPLNTPQQVLAAGILLYMASYAFVYYPFRQPGQTAMALVALASLT